MAVAMEFEQPQEAGSGEATGEGVGEATGADPGDATGIETGGGGMESGPPEGDREMSC